MQTAIRSACLFVVCLVVASVLGCATARIYSGPQLPPDQVAFLERGDLSQSLSSIDGRESGNFFLMNRALEILPGEHTIVVGYNSGSKHSTQRTTLTFTAKPGTRYILKSNAVGMRWEPTIVEKE